MGDSVMVEEGEEKVCTLLPLQLPLLVKVEGKREAEDPLRERARGEEEKEEKEEVTDREDEIHETTGEGAHADGMNEQKGVASPTEDDGEADPRGLMLMVLLVVALELARGTSAETKGKYPPPKDQVIQRRAIRMNGGWWLMPRPRRVLLIMPWAEARLDWLMSAWSLA